METESLCHFIGIDVSKETLDVCLLRKDGSKVSLQVKNTAAGFGQLMTLLHQHGASAETSVCCLEHTGCYDDRLLEALTVNGWACAVEKTTVLKQVGPSHHRKADRFDAALLAEYAARYPDRLSIYVAPDPVVEQIRVLSGERRRLVNRQASVRQLMAQREYRAGITDFTVALWQQELAFTEALIAQVEQQIETLLHSDSELHRRYEQIKAIDGIGPKTAVFWICLFAGQSTINARKVASWFGFAPHGRRSGTSYYRNARSTGHGRSEARKLFHLCAESAIRNYEHYGAYHDRKLTEGKKHAVIKNNVVNKLIRVICAVWNADSSYDPKYVSPFAAQAA